MPTLSDYDAYPSDDLRIDRETLSRFDCSQSQILATAYPSAKISNLVRYLKRFKENGNSVRCAAHFHFRSRLPLAGPFRREVAPFIVGRRALDVWSQDFFRQIIPRIISI